MTLIKDELRNNYLKWLSERISYNDIENNVIEITTPFLDRHNDYLQIYAEKNNNLIRLSDDGYIINDLEISGLDLNKSAKRKELFTSILLGYGVQYDKEYNELFLNTTMEDFARKKHMLLQAMMTVNDMFLTSKSNVTSIFIQEVSSFLEEKEVRFADDIQFIGKSGFSHKFNFVVPKFKGIPERVIHTINNPTKANTGNLIFSWDDAKVTRKHESSLYVFVNDNEKKINNNVIDAFGEYGINAIPWSQRDTVVDILLA